ncbi:uncharacterized protein LOC101456404 [Ceratitis capitata]|uniref:Protein CUSTOS n=1 Tax=Ceratitis capitata TaxID=7213 RepID=W8CBA6_CERCA|nr:uncharacterized protein LOC101456404 [Ceratitis capitata]
MRPRDNEESSSDSDDGNDEQMRQFLEAADTTLLTNTMYQMPLVEHSVEENITESLEKVEEIVIERKEQKSNRYLLEESAKDTAEFIATDAVKKHVAKKLSEIIARNVEFFNVDTPTKFQKPGKSRITLIAGADCYVKSYEEFEYETEGPTKRPVIKRRKIDAEETETPQELIASAAVSVEDVTSGRLTAGWQPRKERKDKVFYYKSDSVGTLHSKPADNEFTKQRKKNQWNESKIKLKRKTTTS